MGTTNVYGWHYPEATDPPNGAAQIQQVAEDVEATVSGIDSGKLPFTRIDWVNLTATGTGISIRNRLRVMRHATGQIEFQVSINIASAPNNTDPSPSNGESFCTLPSWAAFPGAALLIPLATNNTTGAKAYFSTGSDGLCTLALSQISTLSGRFCEGVAVWSA